MYLSFPKVSFCPLVILPLNPPHLPFHSQAANGLLSVTIDQFVFSKILCEYSHAVCTVLGWLVSLDIITLRLIQVGGHITSSSLFIAKQYSVVELYHCVFIHSSADGHFGYLQFLAATNEDAVNICAQTFVQTYALFSWVNTKEQDGKIIEQIYV